MRWGLLCAVALALAPLPSVAQQAETRNGYGPYRFGMTADEARAADRSLRPIDVGGDIILLVSRDPTHFGSIPLYPRLSFRDGRLNRITFDLATIATSPQCVGALTSVVRALESSTGPLDGSQGPGEYGRRLQGRVTPGGSEIRYYAFDELDQEFGHANTRRAGWVEARVQLRPHAQSPSDGRTLCTVEVELREQAPPELARLDPPTLEQLSQAQRIEEPHWLAIPTSDTLEMTLPQVTRGDGVRVDIDFDCLVLGDGSLNCVTIGSGAQNDVYSEAALRLTRSYRIAQQLDGDSTEGRRVRANVNFTLAGPGGVPPPPSPQERADIEELRALAAQAPSRAELDAAPLIEGAIWLDRPDAEAFTRHYPHQALARSVSGRVVLECLVQDDGRLRCAITEETPQDEGFGLAALGIARNFRIAPEINGVRTASKRVRVPVGFRIG